jgi:hypothetical protein
MLEDSPEKEFIVQNCRSIYFLPEVIMKGSRRLLGRTVDCRPFLLPDFSTGEK